MKKSLKDKLARLPSMTRRNCKHMISIFSVTDFKKTDDGGRNYKYNYHWSINCKKEGKFTETVEGQAQGCKVPSCSGWKPKN